MESIKIKNLNALKDSMANMLYTWSMESAAGDSVQKDMYLYRHEDGTAHVEEFTNIGHSDYREDDHILLYSYQSNADLWECMQLSDTCAPDVAMVCGIPVEELEDRVVAWLESNDRHEEAVEAWQEFITEYLTECPDAEDLQTAALQHYGDWLMEETNGFLEVITDIIEENGLEQADEKGENTMDLTFTADSFGSECPANYKEICTYLNAELENRLQNVDPSDDREAKEVAVQLWEAYCDGELPDAPEPSFIWYAVMPGRDEDNLSGWDNGSADLKEAIAMAREWRADGNPDAYIAVIDTKGGETLCVDEIRDLDGAESMAWEQRADKIPGGLYRRDRYPWSELCVDETHDIDE